MADRADGRDGSSDVQRADHAADLGWEQGSAGVPVRVVRQAPNGRVWRVRLADTSRVPGAPTDHCLVFDAGECVRRVWRVPDDWTTLPPAALLALMDAGAGRHAAQRVTALADGSPGAPPSADATRPPP